MTLPARTEPDGTRPPSLLDALIPLITITGFRVERLSVADPGDGGLIPGVSAEGPGSVNEALRDDPPSRDP